MVNGRIKQFSSFLILIVIVIVTVTLIIFQDDATFHNNIYLKSTYIHSRVGSYYDSKAGSNPHITYIDQDAVVFPFGRFQLKCSQNTRLCRRIHKGELDSRILGVLLAIKYEASFVYFTHKHKDPYLSKVQLNNESREMVYQGSDFSVDKYFNSESIPMSFIQKRTSEIQTPFIQSKSNLQQDVRAPSVTLPAGMMSPYKLNNTLVSYNALWSLLIPMSTDSSHCQTWLSLVSQRLMWEIGGTIKFYMPNETSVALDTSSNLQDWMVKLKQWQCSAETPFFGCVRSLFDHFTSAPCGEDFRFIVVEWLNELKAINYQEPQRQNLTSSYINNLYYAPMRPRSLDGDKQQIFTDQFKKIKLLCDKYPSKLQTIGKVLNRHIYDNLILLIVFNKPHYDNIPNLHLTYSAVFPRIVYCGSDIKTFQKSAEKFSENVTFVDAISYDGNYNYICMARVMEMGFNVDGYLFIGDDTLLNTRKIEKYPKNKQWIVLFEVFRQSTKQHHRWGNWNLAFGRPAFLSALNELEQNGRENLKKFQENLYNNTGVSDGLFKMGADIYYVPAQFEKDFIFYANHFYKHKLFLEIAVGTIMAGIAPKPDITIVPGEYLWGEARKNYSNIYNNDLLYMHPVKFGVEMKSVNGLKFFCERYFPFQLYGHD